MGSQYIQHVLVTAEDHERLKARAPWRRPLGDVIHEILDTAEYHEAHCIAKEEGIQRPKRRRGDGTADFPILPVLAGR